MKLSGVWAVGLLYIASGMGSLCAKALDAPQPVHHSKSQLHLSTSHRTTAHHTVTHSSSAHAPSSVTHSATVHSSSRIAAGPHTVSHAGVNTLASTASTGAHLQRTSLPRRHHYYERFTASSFVPGGVGEGDITAGEDPVVRQAAIDALGDMNGTAVVIDPSNGRILAMVNQKLALSPGAEPCSTIKITVAMAALSEGIVTRDTMVQLPGFRMNMTQALAKSNNLYFEELGRELGFERVRHYANQFGLGELAGYHIEGEQLGVYPDQALSVA